MRKVNEVPIISNPEQLRKAVNKLIPWYVGTWKIETWEHRSHSHSSVFVKLNWYAKPFVKTRLLELQKYLNDYALAFWTINVIEWKK